LPPAYAVTTSWNTNSGGQFTTASNWDNGVPDGDDAAVFNRGAGITYSVTFPGGPILNPPPTYFIDYLRVNSNTVSFVGPSLPSQTIPNLTVLNPSVSIVIGENAGEVGILNMGLNILSGANTSIGRATGASGTLHVSAGTFNMSGSIDIGDSGIGAMNVTGGGDVMSSGSNIGQFSGGVGHATVSGVGSNWTISSNINVGLSGDGTLDITNGSAVSVGGIANVGPNGQITMDGTATLLSSTFAIDVGSGAGGTGEMTVTGGARVVTYTGAVGSHTPGSIGTLVLDGTDASGNPSSWLAEYGPNIGLSPTSQGSISILNGALLRTINSMNLGEAGSGQVVVDGTDGMGNPSLMDIGTLNIGYLASATGQLTARAGGRIEANQLVVGVAGTGNLAIESGGSVVVSGNTTVGVGSQINISNGSFAGTGNVSINGGSFTADANSNVSIGPGVAGAGIVVHPTGHVQLQGGMLNLNANTTLDDGSITRTSGDINLAAGRTLTAQNNSQINFGDTSIELSGGTAWNINSGADLVSTNLVSIGNNSSGTTNLTVDGVGSSMNVSFPSGAGGAIWGRSGSANVTFRNGATANILSGAGSGIGLAFAPAAGTASSINVESGADVVIGNVQINNSGGSANSSGIINVTGTGSTLMQSGASQLIVGRTSGGTATINLTSGGNYTTGTGLTRVNATGLININSGGGDGFTATGDVLVDGGTIQRQSGLFRWAATLTIQNGGDVLLGGLGTSSVTAQTTNVTGNGSLLSATGGYVQLGSGDQLNITSGGHYSAFSLRAGIGAGTSTVLVDGSGSTIVATSSSQLGVAGGTANITFQNSATGSLNTSSGTLGLASDGAVGNTANVSVLSGADVSARTLEVANNGVGTATLTIDGSGSTFTQLGVAAITLGHAATGSGAINVRNSAIFTTGTGPINVNSTGAINIESGAVFDARGPVNLNGGAFNFLGGRLHVDSFTGNLTNQGGTLAPGHSAGNTTIVGSYTQQSAAKLEIEIGGTSAGSAHDVASATGSAVLGGELRLVLINGFVPTAANSFTVLSAAGGISGAFGNAPNGKRWFTTDGSGTFVVHYGPGSAFNPNQVRLTDFQPTPTGLVAYEPFDYSPAGANLVGANGGSGFAGPWTAGTLNHFIGTESLSFADLNTVGNRVTSDALPAAPLGNVNRELTVPLGSPGTTAYLSFVIRPEDTLHQGVFSGFFGLRLFASTGDNLFIGKTGGGALDKWVLEDQGGAQQHASGVDVVVDEEFLLVVRADFNVGNDLFTLYVNPTPGTTEPLTGTVKNDSDVGFVRTLGLYSTGAFSFDELRIGTSYADVVPAGLFGDYNNDGTVDAADYVVWRKFTGTSTTLPNDPHGGTIGPQQFDTWRAHFGQTAGNGGLSNTTVPEPAGLLLVILVVPLLRSPRW
jgi:T5SS/PEP-CTERM-associated repeat protein